MAKTEMKGMDLGSGGNAVTTGDALNIFTVTIWHIHYKEIFL